MNEVAIPTATFAVRRAIEQPVAGAADAELRQAARDFETVYLTEMLTTMGVAREPETFGGGFWDLATFTLPSNAIYIDYDSFNEPGAWAGAAVIESSHRPMA